MANPSIPTPSAASGRTVAVTGATGFVGRHLVRELLSRGHTVRALVRDAQKAKPIARNAAVEIVVGDVCDSQALDRLLKTSRGTPVDACIHLVGIIREVRGDTTDLPQTFQRMHVLATQKIVDACRNAGVKRFLQMSALGAASDGKAEYQRTKWEAERYVRRAFGDGTDLDWTIFRPSLIHGADGEFVQMFAKIAAGEAPPFLFMPYFAKTRRDERVPAGATFFEPPTVQPVAVEDVAIAFAEALARPEESIGEIYNLAGSEVMTWPEMLEFFRDHLPKAKKNMGSWYIPGEHAAIMALIAKAVGLGRLLPFDHGQAVMGAMDSVADTGKAQVHLGLKPRGFREMFHKYAATV